MAYGEATVGTKRAQLPCWRKWKKRSTLGGGKNRKIRQVLTADFYGMSLLLPLLVTKGWVSWVCNWFTPSVKSDVLINSCSWTGSRLLSHNFPLFPIARISSSCFCCCSCKDDDILKLVLLHLITSIHHKPWNRL